jgi:perosamine synthetase
MIWRRVPNWPVLNPFTLLAPPRNALPPPLNAPTARFYSYGRVALLHGLQLLRIRSGDNVLIPSFICPSVLAPFNALGIGVRYYEVNDNLQPKLDTAAQALDSGTKAFLGVHYFGFPHDVKAAREFCNDNGLYYIEDNAHGFLSVSGSRPLGTYGDVSIFSQRKTVSLPHGGALVVNNSDLHIESQANASRQRNTNAFTISTFFLRNIVLHLDIFRGLDVASFNRKLARVLSGDADEENDLTDYLEPYSNLANWILFRVDFEEAKKVRRKSYLFWQKVIENWKAQEVSPVFDELSAGVVPLGFPVRVRKRGEFVDELNKQGIGCFPWPTLPNAAPRTQLSKEVAVIPLHRFPAWYSGGT